MTPHAIALDAAPPPISPRGVPPLPVRFCKECGHPYYPRREDQDFCQNACRSCHHHRRTQRGAQLYDFAMAWRSKRRKGGFTDFCRLIDEWLAEDRQRRKDLKDIRAAYERGRKTNGSAQP